MEVKIQGEGGKSADLSYFGRRRPIQKTSSSSPKLGKIYPRWVILQ